MVPVAARDSTYWPKASTCQPANACLKAGHVAVPTHQFVITVRRADQLHAIKKKKKPSIIEKSLFIVNDDPRTMDPNDRCYTCYNSDVSVTCKGKLIRSQPTSETERFVTSEKCKQVGGTCCMKSPTYAFNPNYISDNCNDCYSGQVALPCGGNLLASSNYTAKTCATFGGRCCDQSPTGIIRF